MEFGITYLYNGCSGRNMFVVYVGPMAMVSPAYPPLDEITDNKEGIRRVLDILNNIKVNDFATSLEYIDGYMPNYDRIIASLPDDFVYRKKEMLMRKVTYARLVGNLTSDEPAYLKGLISNMV